jgi:hypothetical protein
MKANPPLRHSWRAGLLSVRIHRLAPPINRMVELMRRVRSLFYI